MSLCPTDLFKDDPMHIWNSYCFEEENGDQWDRGPGSDMAFEGDEHKRSIDRLDIDRIPIRLESQWKFDQYTTSR